MFQEFYGFQTLPFSQGLATSQLFPASGQAELKARLTYLVRERGIGLITGEIGSGKSTALRAFVESLDPTRYTVVYTANPLIGSSGIYRDVLSQLGEPVPMFRQQMVLAIRRCFDVLSNERKRTPIVIIDEAHLLDQRSHQLPAALQPLLAVVRVVDAQLAQAAPEPRHVLVEAEQLAAVDRNDFVDAVSEHEAAVEHRDLGLRERQVLAVQVAERVGNVHGVSAATTIVT